MSGQIGVAGRHARKLVTRASRPEPANVSTIIRPRRAKALTTTAAHATRSPVHTGARGCRGVMNARPRVVVYGSDSGVVRRGALAQMDVSQVKTVLGLLTQAFAVKAVWFNMF